MSRSRKQIEDELTKLNKQITNKFASFIEYPRGLMRSIVEAKVSHAALKDIEAHFAGYNTFELVTAGEILCEAQALSDATGDGEVPH